MSSETLYRCTPRMLRSYLLDIAYAGLVPFVKGSPGMGKSSIYRSVAHELRLWMIDHRISTSEPTDATGLPQFVNGRARFAPFDELFPVAGTPIPEGFEGWYVFLDEFNSGEKRTMAAFYKLLLDRMVGQHPLHDKVIMGLAGNLDTDRAITNTISTALQSRVVTLILELSHKEWMEDVALKQNFDHRIVSYLSYKEGNLMDFRPDHNEHTFCCPRTWEFMNKLISGEEVTDAKTALYAGTITSGVAVDFVQYCQVFKNLITIRQILGDPDHCPLPGDKVNNWAVVGHMIDKVDEKNFDGLATYANRLGLDFRVLFYRSGLVRHPELRSHPAFRKAMGELSQYLHSN